MELVGDFFMIAAGTGRSPFADFDISSGSHKRVWLGIG